MSAEPPASDPVHDALKAHIKTLETELQHAKAREAGLQNDLRRLTDELLKKRGWR